MILVCKECKEYPAKVVEDNCSGDTICGLVLGDHMIDIRPEWRTFAGDDDTGVDPNRCGDTASTLLQGNQLETAIAFDNSAAGRGISRSQKKTHEKTHDNPTNKVVLKGYSDIDAYCQSMALTGTVSETIKQYFKKAYESKAVKGKDCIAIIASCISLACRCCGVARTFHEVMAITKCSKRELSWTFAVLSKWFQNEETSTTQHENTNTARGGTTHSMIPHICSHLQINYKTQKIAVELMKKVERLETLGASRPGTMAGAVIYLVCNLNDSQKSVEAISSACGVAPSTIVRAYKTLYQQ